MPFFTDIYKIDNEGNIAFLATYSLSKEKALKCAVLQFLQKRYNTWNYDKIKIPLHVSKRSGQYMYFYDSNSALYTRNERWIDPTVVIEKENGVFAFNI